MDFRKKISFSLSTFHSYYYHFVQPRFHEINLCPHFLKNLILLNIRYPFSGVRKIVPEENCPPVWFKIWFRICVRIKAGGGGVIFLGGNFPRTPFSMLSHFCCYSQDPLENKALRTKKFQPNENYQSEQSRVKDKKN